MKIESQIRLISIESIIPNRFQPRLQFEDEALQELADSIREHGIIQPLVLRRVADKYEIIAGERRYKASQLAGLTQVPAIITDLNDNESAEVAIIENTHRRNLSALEEAKSYKKLLDRRYVTQDQLAKRLGTSQSNIANKIRLLALDENVQNALAQDKISERHARSLLKVTDKQKQVDLLNKIIAERWPVRKLDEEIENVINGYKKNEINSGINTNRLDVNIDDVVNNSEDIHFDIPNSGEYIPKYQYQGRIEDKNKKNSIFFNNLENEEANMDPTLSFGFNPFKNKVNTNSIDTDNDDDIEILGEDLDDVAEIKVDGEVEENNTISVELNNREDVENAIKDIINRARANNIDLEMEEFNFDQLYQFVIRIDKEKEE